MKDVVVKWWIEETQVSQRKRNVVKRLIGVKQYEEHVGHFYQESWVAMILCLFFYLIHILTCFIFIISLTCKGISIL
jgi:hypothetical protein